MHGGQTNGAKSRLSLLDSPWSSFGRRRLAKPGGCVRPKRVVSAPVAGAKSAEVLQAQPGFAKPPIADDGDKTNSSPRSARQAVHAPCFPHNPGPIFRACRNAASR